LTGDVTPRQDAAAMKIRGAVAIVTGASSGIGAATAVELARRGATVVAVARRRERLDATVADCRRHAAESIAHPADVADRAACDELVARTAERLGKVDIVVNNAGISLRRHAAQASVEEIERVMQVNFYGAVYLTTAALPGMLERRSGSVVNVTSVAGYIPNPRESAYGASKAALSLWSHGLAVDLADSGVHVGVLSPGPIDTEIWEKDEEEAAYDGKLYPPSVVAEGIAKMIEAETVHATVPKQYGLVGAFYPLVGGLMRKGLVEFQRRAERKGRAATRPPKID
jgi:short-subunit dehydrogenase